MAPRVQITKLTQDEEIQLFEQLGRGEIDRREVVEMFLYLIPANMKQYTFQREDLYQEGVLALYRAVDGFDVSRGLRFSTYASHWLRQAAFSYLYDHGSTIRIPVYMRKLMNRIARGEDPGDVTSSSIDIAHKMLTRKTGTLPTESRGEPDDEIDELTPILRAALNELPERERRLVKQRFIQGRTLASISREEGVSLERVRQIIQRALPKLRSRELRSLLP
jgi:RNA polymerase primary sigma factor